MAQKLTPFENFNISFLYQDSYLVAVAESRHHSVVPQILDNNLIGLAGRRGSKAKYY
jgi:hypothetical protein